jgi:hypothetical protein
MTYFRDDDGLIAQRTGGVKAMRTGLGLAPLTILVTIGVALVAGITSATANIGVINGCYKTNNGQLRLIDTATAHCLPSETAISWSETGPQGPTGAPGATGATGATGAQGPQGVPGTGTGPLMIRGGTYGGVNGLGVYAGSGFTIATNSPGNYTISFPPGTWTCYPIATFQAFFRPVTPTIQFASGDGLIWTIDWGGENTTFDFIFVNSCG